jgi:hypothetical protein
MRLWWRVGHAPDHIITAARGFFVAVGLWAFISFRINHRWEDIMASFDTIAEQVREFYYFVGVAVTDWAHIDQELFRICADILKSDGQHVAIVFYRTPTLSARLNLVDELIHTIFPKPTRKSGAHPSESEKIWNKLYNDINEVLSVRNQLAHSPSGPLIERSGEPPVPHGITDVWFASYMSATEKLRGRPDSWKELKIDNEGTS